MCKEDIMLLSKLKTKIIGKRRTGETFVRAMMILSIIKLVAMIVILMVMTAYFFTHIHTFAPITSQFSKWSSFSLIGFILTMKMIKFAGILIGLTLIILSVKKILLKPKRIVCNFRKKKNIKYID